MIPKIIHYCWFGGNPLPKSAVKCMESWKKFCPDYEIREWNESNFDVNCNAYVREAYAAKKFAFVSDYARLWALCGTGGIYMDTDVEVLQSFDALLQEKAVLGFEQKNMVATSFMAAEPNHPLMHSFLNLYRDAAFQNTDGSLNVCTNVTRLTEMLEKQGLKRENVRQSVADATIYPTAFFSPYDYINCVDERTAETFCIHWFEVSWKSKTEKLKKNIKRVLVRIVGKQGLEKLRTAVKKQNKSNGMGM